MIGACLICGIGLWLRNFSIFHDVQLLSNIPAAWFDSERAVPVAGVTTTQNLCSVGRGMQFAARMDPTKHIQVE
jgi:hypothetical protein